VVIRAMKQVNEFLSVLLLLKILLPEALSDYYSPVWVLWVYCSQRLKLFGFLFYSLECA